METAARGRPLTAPAVRARKGGEPLVMVTAYDAPSARVVDRAGADMILVGDSLAMVVLGYDDTLQVTTEDMAHHVGAVARTRPRALVVGDLPWMSYHVSREETVRNAATLVRAGAGAVKLEGGRKRLDAIAAILDIEIPVMGHLGLTPQSVHALGGFKVQGKQLDAARAIVDDAIALDKQQPAFGDDGEPAWRQAIDLAAAYAAKGDTAGARGRLAGVTDDLKARLVSEPGNRRLNSWLGLAEALLGEREAALKHGQEAVRLATEEGDAVALPAAKLRLALIQSWTNDLDAAFAGLAALLPKEGLEITVPAMKLDPWFAKLRADARFGTLAADPKNNAPLISDLSGRGGRSGRGGPGGPGGQNIRGGFAPNGQIPVDQRGGRGNRQGNGQIGRAHV